MHGRRVRVRGQAVECVDWDGDSGHHQSLALRRRMGLSRRHHLQTAQASNLLMKEVDAMRAVTSGTGSECEHHYKHSVPGPSSGVLSQGAYVHVHEHLPPPSTHSAARAFLSAMRNRCRQRRNSLDTVAKKNEQHIELNAQAHSQAHSHAHVNGHASTERHSNTNAHPSLLHRTQSGSPSTVRRSRGKSRFLLDLKSSRRAPPSPPKTMSHINVNVPVLQSSKTADEHGMIAQNSALLCKSTIQEPVVESPSREQQWPEGPTLTETVSDSPCRLAVGEPSTSCAPEQSTSFATCSTNMEAHSLPQLPECCLHTSPSSDMLLQCRNRTCTSYSLRVPSVKHPVDMCVLPNGCLAIADYDNGFVLLNRSGDLVQHCAMIDNKSACGVACTYTDRFRFVVLGYKDQVWSINIYAANLELIECVLCPEDTDMEAWALHKITVAHDNHMYLVATGEHKLVIWSYDFEHRSWRTLVTENSRRGAYNDFAIRFDQRSRDTHFLLCDAKKAQLSMVAITDQIELAGIQTVKMRRAKGQEWIVQGPKLACWDQDGDIVLYDGSGKLFLFDGAKFKCKKVIADLGKGEVGALCVSDGWCYALCRLKLTVDAFMYKTVPETAL